jgi:Mlc titration factor MtfA (ptsG expression regulator)
MSLAFVLGLALLLSGAIALAPRWRAWRRERWAGQPFPPAWRTILRRRVPLYRRLPPHLQQQLRRHMQVFLAEKPFLGCGGLVVTDEVRVTIAAHACLLRLNRGGPLFPELRQVLVYPGAFVVDRLHPEAGGVLREERRTLAGESWSRGQVILSWQDVLDGARVVDDGHNVVLHEFAHQLDQDSGTANGAPRLATAALQARWAEVMSAEFEALQGRIRAREAARWQAGAASWGHEPGWAGDAAFAEPELISDYGATNPAEFFAVVTEVFFEQPSALAGRHPALFMVLRDFYRVDPRDWE